MPRIALGALLILSAGLSLSCASKTRHAAMEGGIVIEVTNEQEALILKEFLCCARATCIVEGNRYHFPKDAAGISALERLLVLSREISLIATKNISSSEEPNYQRARWRIVRRDSVVELEVVRTGKVDLDAEMGTKLGAVVLIQKLESALADRSDWGLRK